MIKTLAFAALTALAPLAAAADNPTGPATPAYVAEAVAAHGWVPLDSFRRATDPDDTNALERAAAAGAAIELGPRTYVVNNAVIPPAAAPFILRGTKGESIIQRTNVAGGTWIVVHAAGIYIDGVTFDGGGSAVPAAQDGVILAAPNQNAVVRNSIFRNVVKQALFASCFAYVGSGPADTGSLDFSDNEVANCAGNAISLYSSNHARVTGNDIHDNQARGLAIGGRAAAPSVNFTVTGNDFTHNGRDGGLLVGVYTRPYQFGNGIARDGVVANNDFTDNAGYQMGAQNAPGVSITGNRFTQTAPDVPFFGGIDCNTVDTVISGNVMSFRKTHFGIDCGGARNVKIQDNRISMGIAGTAIDAGGTSDSVMTGNRISVGHGAAITVSDLECDGQGYGFPNHAANDLIQDNDIARGSAVAAGVVISDNAGAVGHSRPIQVRDNRFTASGGAAAARDIIAYGNAIITGNTHDGASMDEAARAMQPGILYVTPASGGAGYHLGKVALKAGGGCSWTGYPLINQGVILGVHTQDHGTGCSGATTITATDSGTPPGSGARFMVTAAPGSTTKTE